MTGALRYLCRDDVVRVAAGLDAAAVIRDALVRHAAGETTLPEEAYLGWTASDGTAARSLALPGALWGEAPAVGMKIINACLGNPQRGVQRAQGVTLVFDVDTAHPVAILEAAYLSALRTAAYTSLSVETLANRPLGRIAVIGCGALGIQHMRTLSEAHGHVVFAVYDHEAARARSAAAALAEEGILVEPVAGWQAAVADAEVIIATTTTTTGYMHHDAFRPGALIAHVSLDDLLPDVVMRADLLVVDDWPLVSADERRLLGRMFRAGRLTGPGGEAWETPEPDARPVDASLADVLVERHPGRTSTDEIIVSNPFGMGILDVALAAEVANRAEHLGIGTMLSV